MRFTSKKILIISPQPWGIIYLSKHHYAIELTKAGNEVYFLSPPDDSRDRFILTMIEGYHGLFEIRHSLSFNSHLRFRFRWLYDVYMRRHVRRLVEWLKFIPDVVWCFEPNLYADLNWFKASLKIYHPVDPIVRPDQIKVGRSADMIFSVSNKILTAFEYIDVPRHFINHGLSDAFTLQAEKNLQLTGDHLPNKPVKIGYVGNLLRNAVHRDLVVSLIHSNPDLEFHFWGPYKLEQNNISGIVDDEAYEFIDFLSSASNVVLKGARKPESIAIEIQQMDLFLFSYKPIHGISDLSNSHKILEYLSTGKAIISLPIETYKGLGLLVSGEESEFSDLLTKSAKNIKDLNRYDLRKKRLKYALDNSMSKQIERIESILKSVIDG